MIMKIISIDAGAERLAHAREAVSGLSGVVAAEIVSGTHSMRVWQGESLDEGTLMRALERSGVRAHISAPIAAE